MFHIVPCWACLCSTKNACSPCWDRLPAESMQTNVYFALCAYYALVCKMRVCRLMAFPSWLPPWLSWLAPSAESTEMRTNVTAMRKKRDLGWPSDDGAWKRVKMTITKEVCKSSTKVRKSKEWRIKKTNVAKDKQVGSYDCKTQREKREAKEKEWCIRKVVRARGDWEQQVRWG